MSELVDRRDFGRQFTKGLAALGLAAHGGHALADDADAKPSPPATTESEPLDEVELALQTIVTRYPHERLTADVLDSIRGEIAHNQAIARELARYPLKNSDAPALVFSAWRAPQSEAVPPETK